MGAKNRFYCEHCDYEALVSGGDDIGMAVRTTTITCDECKQLFDVVTRYLDDTENQEPLDKQLTCPGPAPGFSSEQETGNLLEALVGNSAPRGDSKPNHHVRRWSFPGLCPRCGHRMTKGDLILNWD